MSEIINENWNIEFKTRLDDISYDWKIFFSKKQFFQDKINFSDEVATDYICEVIGNLNDSTKCIDEFIKFSEADEENNLHKNILLHIGFLQSLYVQQDLLTHLLEIFVLNENIKSVKKDFRDDRKTIRCLRNKLVGHPISKDGGTLQTSVFWSNKTDSHTIRFREYPKGKFDQHNDQQYNVFDLMSEHEEYMKKYLDIVLERMNSIKKLYLTETEKYITMNDDDLFKELDILENNYLSSFDKSNDIYQYDYIRYANDKQKQSDDKYGFYKKKCLQRIRDSFIGSHNIKIEDLPFEQKDFGLLPQYVDNSMKVVVDMSLQSLEAIQSIKNFVDNLNKMYFDSKDENNSEKLHSLLDDMKDYFESKDKAEYCIAYVMLDNELREFNKLLQNKEGYL